ncbi:cytochrome ubiquinol oxidase subunit I [Actinacidiphila oryziradicis]|uniref:Cytochrome ubiquinol oxidase subunit I n=1 Tax=Actinacidiphila oryziradicis TaxID=2571141 RepID=A0A4U0RLB4_9ACTN|nr:cytochrome ubiquinol oxidase subunit I [Actinacidiphila oryziradicis]
MPLTVAALAAPVQVLVGDWAGREVASIQPVKLAAMEGLPATTRGALLHLLGWFTDSGVECRIRHRDFQGAVAGGFPQPERGRSGTGLGAARRLAAGQRGAVQLPDDGRDRVAARPSRSGLPLRARATSPTTRIRLVLSRGRGGRPALARGACVRLGGH